MTYHIYFRILGYLITITMHTSNMVVMMSSFHGEPMKNDYVRHFSEMQFLFLTCWTFTLQTIYSIFGLCTDILTLMNSKSVDYELPKFVVDSRDAFFAIIVWPSTLLVFMMFWSFFYFDRNLFYPKDIDVVITSTSNHIMHTYILPATLWEVIFRQRKAPKTHKWYMICVWLLAVVYTSVLLYVHAIRGVWIYPIFGVIAGTIYFYLLFASVIVVLYFIYHSQWALSSAIWGRENWKKID